MGFQNGNKLQIQPVERSRSMTEGEVSVLPLPSGSEIILGTTLQLKCNDCNIKPFVQTMMEDTFENIQKHTLVTLQLIRESALILIS